mmetsp:Transcript_12107/g.19642  ORF Transcript_12107/g.19642 Transcript_12107/m.19642 type:complete len:479 (+) Transcript_12107:22-1458(+)
MPTGILRKWLDGRQRVDGQAFGFIQPDDGSQDVFAPARTLRGRRDCVSEGLEVTYELKEDDRKGTPMASSWAVPESARSRSRSKSSKSSSSSPRTKRTQSHSRSLRRPSRSLQRPAQRSGSRNQRSRSPHNKKPSKPRSPPPIRKSPSPHKIENVADETFKVTICDIPKTMTYVELEYLAGDLGAPVVSSKTYRSGERYHGLVEFYDKADADACIAELEGKSLPGSEFKLRCLHGELEARPTPRNIAKAKLRPMPKIRPRFNARRRSRSLPRKRRSPPRQHDHHNDRRDHHNDRRDHHNDRHEQRNDRYDQYNDRESNLNDKGDKQPGVSTYVRPGDWECPHCRKNVFASKTACPYCGEHKPHARRKKSDEKQPLTLKRSQGSGKSGGADIRPGDWECPKCGENVFRRNLKCFKCGHPKDESSSNLEGDGSRRERDRGGDVFTNGASKQSESDRSKARREDRSKDKLGERADGSDKQV